MTNTKTWSYLEEAIRIAMKVHFAHDVNNLRHNHNNTIIIFYVLQILLFKSIARQQYCKNVLVDVSVVFFISGLQGHLVTHRYPGIAFLVDYDEYFVKLYDVIESANVKSVAEQAFQE